jgi:hypothetical protein
VVVRVEKDGESDVGFLCKTFQFDCAFDADVAATSQCEKVIRCEREIEDLVKVIEVLAISSVEC